MAKVNTVFVGPGKLDYTMLAPLFPNLPRDRWRTLASQRQINQFCQQREPNKPSMIILNDESMSQVEGAWMESMMDNGHMVVYIWQGKVHVYHRDWGHVPDTTMLANPKPFTRALIEA